MHSTMNNKQLTEHEGDLVNVVLDTQTQPTLVINDQVFRC